MQKSESARIASYRDLIAWQRSMDLVDLVYKQTNAWPRSETYGLTSQLRRSAVSVPANIAEGQGRNGRKEFVQHLGIARGSLCEVETLLMVGARQSCLRDIDLAEALKCTTEVGKLVRGLIQSLDRRPHSPATDP